MSKEWQIFKTFECPECGNNVEVCTEWQTDNNDAKFWEGDQVRCVECDFKSVINVDEEYAYIVHLD